jgi:hypothetical protein
LGIVDWIVDWRFDCGLLIADSIVDCRLPIRLWIAGGGHQWAIGNPIFSRQSNHQSSIVNRQSIGSPQSNRQSAIANP